MNITKEQVEVGLAAGLALTDPESGINVPIKHAVNGGISILRQLLIAIGSGQLALTPTMQEAPKTPPPGSKGPVPTQKARGKKRAKKRGSKR